MKTLINKTNPQIRITAPEITTAHPPVSNEGYVYWIPDINETYNPIDWTLVVEEPEKQTSKYLKEPDYDKQVVKKMSKELAKLITDQIAEPKGVNCPFDKGDCRYCTVQFCGAREENHIETRSTAEPVDLEKAADDYVMQTASGTAEEMETLIDAFKAGVKWMAEQGITYKDKVMPTTDNSGNIDGYCLDGENEFAAVKAAVENGYLKVGDKVIVQIRKAE